ncbi:MAG: ABC transporter C-terminal domain-containing protein, partial [Candidatus Limnocylindrales bacterium]
LWVVGDGQATAFDGGYRAWRSAVADGWTVAAGVEEQAKRYRARAVAAAGATSTGRSAQALSAPSARRPAGGNDTGLASTTTLTGRPRRRVEKLSKDAYKRQKVALDAELTRLGLRKNHLELAMGDPAVAANFVEMRRVTSELADVDQALAEAEDAWLALEERAP